MLGIQINGEFLDLSPQTTAQLERSSPFFNTDNLAEEYTVPFTFKYSPKNARLLGLQNHFYTRREKKRIQNVRLYDGNNFSYSGDLIIESASLHANDIGKSEITGYFLSGVSAFFQQVKGKKLRELTLGGVRSFVWTNNNPKSVNFGFWQYIHTTLNGTKELSFAPIRNEKWSGSTEDGTPDWMNKLNGSGNLDYEANYTTLAPQISLKYLLEQIFQEHGWQFDPSGMDDQQWEMLFMPSFFSVSWQKIVKTNIDPFFAFSPLPTIQINLQNHVPPNELITSLIIGLRNRFNWGFDFDSARKICRMFPLRDLANGQRKDWTPFMGAVLQSSFSEDKKIYSFVNEIDSADGLSSSPDFTKAKYLPPVESFEDLPAPVEANFNQVAYAWKQNQYYQCRYNEETDEYEWGIWADGIYNYEPDGHNQDITTAISTMPVYRTLWRTGFSSDFYGYFPLCEQEGNWEGKEGDFVPWGMRLLFHRGYVWEANPQGLQGDIKYPYLTSICFTPTQTEPDLEWSNVYRHFFDGIDKGIVDYWWRDTLQFTEQSEVLTCTLYLPRLELVNFRWSDVILLRNIPYVGQKLTEVIPYDGSVRAELRRIG